MFLLLIIIYDVGFGDENRSLGDKLTKGAGISKAITNLHLRYVDDLTIAETVRI